MRYLSIVQFANGPKRSAGHVLGAEKGIFLIRGRGRRHDLWRPRLWNPVNPCPKQVSLGSPRVGTIHAQAPTPHAPPLQAFLADFLSADTQAFSPRLGQGLLPGLSESSRLPHRWRMRYRRLPTTRPTPEGVQEPICPRKKCAIWTRWRPVPVKNVNYPRAPSSRRSGLVGPHTTPAIVNYKYMTSTL